MKINRKKINSAIRYIEFALEGATFKDALFKKPGHRKGSIKYTEEIKRRTRGYRETCLISPLHLAIRDLKGMTYLIQKVIRKQTPQTPRQRGVKKTRILK